MEPVFRTRITDLLGIDHPIVQGGMMWVSRAELVAAVSNAGAFGILTALTFGTPGELAAEIERTRRLTDRPFGVNLTLLPTLLPKNHDAYVDAIVDAGIGIVETAGRNPEPYLARLKSAGIKVIHKCTAVRFAKKAERIGCDAVTIDGMECAGHPGEDDVTSLILTPLAADAVTIPVLACGGFGDGRGLIAALALGADGISMGTRFLATQEAPVHERVKQRLVQAAERDTMLVMRTLRNTERVLRNSVAEAVVDLEQRGAAIDQLAPLVSGVNGRRALDSGDLEAGLLTAGQVAGLVRDVPTVQVLVERIVRQAREIAQRRLPAMLRRHGRP